MFRDIKEVRGYYATLRELVIRHSGGWDDVDSRDKVEELCDAATEALDDTECRERLRAVRTQTRDLFSRDGHNKWARKNMSGADYLRLQILISLEAVNTRLFLIDTERNRASPEKPAEDLPPAFER